MIDQNCIEFRKEKAIKDFKNSFYQRFGLNINIEVQKPDYNVDTFTEYDPKMTAVISIINSRIPDYLKSSFKSIFERSRKRELVILRMIFLKIARDKGLPLSAIVDICGLHHSSVIYNAEMANLLLRTDKNFQGMYESVMHELQTKYILKKNPNAGVIEYIKQTPDISKSASIVTLYTGESKAS